MSSIAYFSSITNIFWPYGLRDDQNRIEDGDKVRGIDAELEDEPKSIDDVNIIQKIDDKLVDDQNKIGNVDKIKEIDDKIKKYKRYRDNCYNIAKVALTVFAVLAIWFGCMYVAPLFVMALFFYAPDIISEIWNSAVKSWWLSSGLTYTAIGVAALGGVALLVAGAAGIGASIYESRIRKLEDERVVLLHGNKPLPWIVLTA